jgi:hypothetical protein
MEQHEAWELYYSTLCSWHLHPGYLREGAVRPSIDEMADLADEMLRVRNERIRRWQP